MEQAAECADQCGDAEREAFSAHAEAVFEDQGRAPQITAWGILPGPGPNRGWCETLIRAYAEPEHASPLRFAQVGEHILRSITDGHVGNRHSPAPCFSSEQEGDFRACSRTRPAF